MTYCLIKLDNCGRISDAHACPKCGLDDQVVFPGQADLEAAVERAMTAYWRCEAADLTSRLDALQGSSGGRPRFRRVKVPERLSAKLKAKIK